MPNIMDRLTGRKTKSASQAKDRLKLVLIHDRTDLTPAALQSMKDELLGVISRYVDISPEEIQINVTQDGRLQRLVADVPLRASQKR